MRVVLFSIVFIFNVFLTNAQTDQSIDVYRILSGVYSSKSIDEIRQAYSQNAVLINLYQKSDPNMIVGMEGIFEYYTKFLKDFAENGQNLELVFKIISRNQYNEKIYDSGYYQLIVQDANGNISKYYGKFNTILGNEDGRWVIQHDATTDNVEVEVFERAEGKISY